ncbi:MAG: cytochrome b/b6 domain-containing protein [Chitinophagaceae bacterium]|nr:MAG: cytochrome b/b6 domain-containing protein [Chitinophagaceae bacterium]
MSITFNDHTKSVYLRIWHWLTFLFFLASISTVIFGSTLFKTKENIAMVQEQAMHKGGVLTNDQARAIAHEFSDKLWMLHKYIGFGLSILMLLRIIIEVAASKQDTVMGRIKAAASIPIKDAEQKHYINVNKSYLLFYMLFIAMSLTGLVLAFEDVKFLDPIHKISKQIHSYVQYGMYAYMVLHIVGVVLADTDKYPGIVSRMINGKK